ncbi:MAG: phosphate signaling complex protein PhoU [Armatimonadetes bacterium]|nr:phosphate signaling complex protein PhoU [Armatimonadota bacterium]
MPALRTTFAAEMEDLEKQLLRMGSFVENMLADAVRALAEQNEQLANEVILRDDIADDMDLSIEQRCMKLLALQQPLARDLRMIGTALKIITDLERIGDYAVDIARLAKSLSHEPQLHLIIDIQRMHGMVSVIIREALRAFVDGDLELVKKVCADDDAVDRTWYGFLAQVINKLEAEPNLVRQGIAQLLVARYLERIADHATNVAERVYYTETGEPANLAPSHKPLLEEGRGGGLPEDI